ncbi:hypothetical protein I350_01199 [Cryptococcus amylolentus CBS 6273]|uniref:Mid2 domain-containing protein n=1 Tax=Cryptococcus amylolentus CBS 6273 TaxID=1296118 RepID=A0A1E3KE96_9TREE|nr:hypothetical protein I350_01199 [Cryptococcus amylolentus CBS 6273]
MSSCEQIPSITIWGTTQITSTSSYFSTFTSLVPGDEITRTATSIVPGTCDDGDDCASSTSVGVSTITMMKTSVGSSAVETQVVDTSIVPQNTLYYPCSNTSQATSLPATASSGSSQPAATQQGTQMQASTTGAYPVTSPLPSSIIVDDGSSTGQFSLGLSQSSSSATRSLSQAVSTASHTITMSGASPFSTGTLSASSSHSTSSTSDGLSDASRHDAASSGSSSNHGAIIGGVVGGMLALLSLLALLLCCLRRRRKRSELPSEQKDDAGDYWERKFRALEAGGGSGSVEGGAEKDEWDLKSSRKLHLTLDLASKDIDITSARRQSRLSTISSFFVSSLGGAVPSRISLNGGLNFSRPLRRRPASSEADGASVKSHPKSPKSVKSSKTQRWSAGSRRSEKSGNRLSAFVLPSMQEEGEIVEEDKQPPTSTEAEEKRVMEWIRQSQFEDERDSLPRYMDNEMSRGEYGRHDTVRGGPPPPSRPPPARLSRKSPPAALPITSPSSSQNAKSSSEEHSKSPYPSHPGTSTARTLYPFYLPIPSQSKVALSPNQSALSSPAIPPSTSSEEEGPASRHYHGTVGKHVPQLHLNAEAIASRLWVGDDLLARYEDFESHNSDKDGNGQVAALAATVDSPYGGITEGGEALTGSVSPSGPSRSPPMSPITPQTANSIASSMDDVSLATITTAERSALTPQLPVLALRSSVVSSWGMGFMGDEERMRTIYWQSGEGH